MSTHRHPSISGRTRFAAAAVTLASAVAVTLAVASGSGATSGGAPRSHLPVPSPAERSGAAAARGPSDPVNPWTLNDPRYFAYLHVPASSPPSTSDLVIPDAERARMLTLIEAGASLEPTYGPSSDLVLSDAERAQLLTLIEAGVPLSANPESGRSGSGG